MTIEARISAIVVGGGDRYGMLVYVRARQGGAVKVGCVAFGFGKVLVRRLW